VLKPVGGPFLQQNKEKIQINRVFKGEFSYVKIFNINLGKILSFYLSEKGVCRRQEFKPAFWFFLLTRRAHFVRS
jgi:hypothetical protein